MIAIRICPRLARHIVFFEPKLFRRTVHTCLIVRACVADERFEPASVSGNPIHHVTAVRSARGRDAIAVNKFVVGDGEVETLHQIVVNFSAPVVRNFIREFLSVSRGAARIDHHYHVPRRREYFRVPTIRPAIFPGALRAAVNQEQRRIFV